MRLIFKADLFHYPIVERAVVSEFTGAERVRNAFERVLNGMREVVHGIYAPFVALTVMMDVLYSVNNGIAEIGVVA